MGGRQKLGTAIPPGLVGVPLVPAWIAIFGMAAKSGQCPPALSASVP